MLGTTEMRIKVNSKNLRNFFLTEVGFHWELILGPGRIEGCLSERDSVGFPIEIERPLSSAQAVTFAWAESLFEAIGTVELDDSVSVKYEVIRAVYYE